jgi:hypothetical protein
MSPLQISLHKQAAQTATSQLEKGAASLKRTRKSQNSSIVTQKGRVKRPAEDCMSSSDIQHVMHEKQSQGSRRVSCAAPYKGKRKRDLRLLSSSSSIEQNPLSALHVPVLTKTNPLSAFGCQPYYQESKANFGQYSKRDTAAFI